MNILFVLYGDLLTNTANPIALFASELKKLGHECVIAIPNGIEKESSLDTACFSTILYSEVLRSEGKIFSGGQKANIIHACTPRIGVVNFLKRYLSESPAPLIFYLEDDELGISASHMNIEPQALYSLSNAELHYQLPEMLSHPFEHQFYLSLADLVILIQEKLTKLTPTFTETCIVPWGVDQSIFHPQVTPSEKWRLNCNIKPSEKVIVYHGGINGITREPIRDLCQAVQLINQNGIPCRLLRTGPNNINFWGDLEPNAREYIKELGVIDREELPSILALGDLFVQPGRINDFEDLRLPSKLPEFFSMGKPVILPQVNISSLLKDDVEAIIMKTGEPAEIAHACMSLFNNPEKSAMLGKNARKFAEVHFDIHAQTRKLINAYEVAISKFNLLETKFLWEYAINGNICEAALLKAEYLLSSARSNKESIAIQTLNWCRQMNTRINTFDKWNVPQDGKNISDATNFTAHAQNIDILRRLKNRFKLLRRHK